MEKNDSQSSNSSISSLYVYSDSLARFKFNHENHPAIEFITPIIMRHIMCKIINFRRLDRLGDEVPAPPPMENFKDILSWGTWPGIPILEGISQIPIIHPDGHLVDSPGYDPRSLKIYWPYRNDLKITLPDKVESHDLDQSKAVIDDLICDFPFIDQSARSNYIALLFTAFTRTIFNDLSPMFLIDSPRAGTGKSLLTMIIGYLATGLHLDSFTQPRDEDEWRKQLSTYLKSGTTVLIIDNVDNTLSSSNLSKFLTSPIWKDRLLGTNQEINLKNRTLTIANGNNISPGKDITRRCVWIRIDSEEAQPWNRPIEKFRHSDLYDYVKIHANDILSAIYTCIKYWIQSGSQPGAAYGSYPAWSRTVGGIMATCGYSGFLENLYEFQTQIDDEYQEWECFLSAWYDEFPNIPVTLRLLRDSTAGNDDFIDCVPGKFSGIWKDNSSKSNSLIGWHLRKKIDTIYGEFQLKRNVEFSEKHKQYIVTKICSENHSVNDTISERSTEIPLTESKKPLQLLKDYNELFK